MLKVFRDNLKYLSWILWVVIGLFVLFVFVDFGSGLGGQAGAPNSVAAHVGDRVVTLEDVQRELRQLDSFYRQIYGEQFTPELAERMQLPRQALERAVNSQILFAEGERLGLEVTDAEIREQILEDPTFLDAQGRFVGREQYTRLLGKMRMTPASFEKEIRQELLARSCRICSAPASGSATPRSSAPIASRWRRRRSATSSSPAPNSSRKPRRRRPRSSRTSRPTATSTGCRSSGRAPTSSSRRTRCAARSRSATRRSAPSTRRSGRSSRMRSRCRRATSWCGSAIR